jgi:hypothetical protein
MGASLNRAHRKRLVAGSREQVDLFHELLADTSNPAWELIDAKAVRQAVERFDELSYPAQVEVMGAATAALWLATGPT